VQVITPRNPAGLGLANQLAAPNGWHVVEGYTDSPIFAVPSIPVVPVV
jgi:hypothetical protein